MELFIIKKVIFKGSAVAVVTPFKEDGSVNFGVLEKLIEFHIDNNTDAIVSCGTTGESATLSEKEYLEILDFTVKKVNKKIPVIAGSGSNNTKHALELSNQAEKLGVDGLVVVTPYYNKTSQLGLVRHYFHIADNINTPVILYNVPSRTGCNILPETYLKLSEHPNIIAVKEANGDISSVAKTISLCKKDLYVYSGNDDQTLPILSLGGIGVISVFANIFPRVSHDIVDKFFSGDIKSSMKLQIKYLKLMNSLFLDINPIPVKEALNILKFEVGKCRLPLVDLEHNNILKLKNILKSYTN
ncbi:MAG: 4-hydroxy-tetrahydrodipicolinate synthase [Candidatus Paraimprobicoccus trichonymphae]|uniref:4-hydroxy-tetrahydrodipicolinate synthase n=1 Tax=Candidatus Paraimprobicoccus trichonymphae TaxID=3033793 RepID=A0AA48I6B9_9FIRM|nr:MAG: 4-hydroxy-tetrahydrodipicolinate synthase [Candidatus Paraimprobicoccus trichonymphae]